jgi:hypothetical protein
MSKKNRPHTPKKLRRPRFRKSDRIADGAGPPCPRCGNITRRWRWPDYRARAMETGRQVYKWWFSCENPRCRTKLIMPAEAIYTPVHDAGAEDYLAQYYDDLGDMAHFRSI